MKNGKKPTLAQKEVPAREKGWYRRTGDREGYAGGAGGSQPGRALKKNREDKNFQEGATMKAMEKKATQCRKNWKESGTKCEFASGCFSAGEPEL